MIVMLLLLFVKINTMAQLSSFRMCWPWDSFLRQNNLWLVFLRVNILNALLLVLRAALYKASTIPWLTQVCTETKCSIGNIGRWSTLVLHSIRSKKTSSSFLRTTSGLSLPRHHGTLELLFINAHVQNIWRLLMLWRRVWLATHSRRLLIGESSGSCCCPLLWIIIRRSSRWTILVLNMQAVARIIFSLLLIVVIDRIAITTWSILRYRIEHIGSLLASFSSIFSGVSSWHLWISCTLLHT